MAETGHDMPGRKPFFSAAHPGWPPCAFSSISRNIHALQVCEFLYMLRWETNMAYRRGLTRDLSAHPGI